MARFGKRLFRAEKVLSVFGRTWVVWWMLFKGALGGEVGDWRCVVGRLRSFTSFLKAE